MLRRAGFDGMVERGGLKKAMGTSGFHVSDILSMVVFYTLVLFVLQLAFGVFGQNPVSDLLTRVIAFLPNVFVAICIVVIGSAVAAAVRKLVEAAIGGLSYGRALSLAASGAILMVAIFAALNQLQIAPQIVNGIFYAMLAIIVGVSVVGVGGGLVLPMQKRWETALNRVEAEAPRIKDQLEVARNQMRPSTVEGGQGYIA